MVVIPYEVFQSATVAQSDLRPIDDQWGTSSIPAGSGNILSWRMIMKEFLRLFSPLR